MDTAQPDIDYMCHLVSLIRDVNHASTTLTKLRNTSGHEWCDDILRNLDYTLSAYQAFPSTEEKMEYSNGIHQYLCDLRDIFKCGSWFKKESQRFSKELAASFETLFENFPDLVSIHYPQHVDD